MEDKYVLKGVFVQFNKQNTGTRIYREEEYLRHLRNYNRKSKIKKILDDQTGKI